MSDNNISAALNILWEEFIELEDSQNSQLIQTQFEKRAQQYAQAQFKKEQSTDIQILSLLIFQLGDKRYGIDVGIVTGIRPKNQITRVPNTPAHYQGITNIRGQIISVSNMYAYLEILSEENSVGEELILIDTGGLVLALLVDYVEGIGNIPSTSIEDINLDYAHGITSDKLIILNTDYLFPHDRLIISGDIK